MAKYKAKEGFSKLKFKYLGEEKIKILEDGGNVEITSLEYLPPSVAKELQEVKKGDK